VLKHLQSREDWTEKSLSAKGFTLIELLVVIIILGILAAVAIFAVGSINDRAKSNSCKNEKGTLETAAEAWNSQMEAYPSSGDAGITQLLTGSATAPDGGSVKAQLKRRPKYWTLDSSGNAVASGGTSALPTGCS
jgi:prepilin-type N-terminal cleavage/methylation domain-containing protein